MCVYVYVSVCMKLIFSKVLYHNGKSNLRHFFSYFLCYNYVMVPFFLFFSLPSPPFSLLRPSPFYHWICLSLVLVDRFPPRFFWKPKKKFFFVPYLIFLFQFARLQNDRFPDWRFHFYNYFFPSHSLAAIFSVCNLGKINNYQIMINYIIHYIHGGSQTIKKIRTSPFSFLGLRKKERIKWNKLNLKKKTERKRISPPLRGYWCIKNVGTPPLKCYFQC